ncbi:MAG: zf-HC2 domain-containing protein [Blastocatellia bacterium]|nr:zf-HC2 domain-containing protein [Blastocatellia bacterium]
MSKLTVIQKITRPFRRAILRVFPSCKEIVHLISASLDRPLTMREKFLMKMHLLACKPCVRYLDQSKFLSQAVKQMSEKEKDSLLSGSLSDESRERIKNSLKSLVMVFY